MSGHTGDIFVTKFASDGAVVYSTYLGGNDLEESSYIAVDALGNAYVTGTTRSTDFPLVNAFQPPSNLTDSHFRGAFVTELKADGSALTFSTYLEAADGGAITVDASGYIYVVGKTLSPDFAATNVLPGATASGADAFITKIRDQAAGSRPLIRSQNGVINAASYQPGISPGAWVSIIGTNFANTSRTWNAETEIIDGKLPTSLDGVEVSIDNKPAFVYYISPTQLNVQAPTDALPASGSVLVTVTTPNGTSDPVSAPVQEVLPGFFAFPDTFVAAVRATDGRYIGPEGLIPGLQTEPAKPGDLLLLFGTGFGPTNPMVAAGEAFNGAARITKPITIRIGGVAASVLFAGLSGAGMYQFNIVVPDVPDGVQPVVATVADVSPPSGAVIAIHR